MAPADIIPFGSDSGKPDRETGDRPPNSIAYGGKLEGGGQYFTITLANKTQYKVGAPSAPSSDGGTVHIKVGPYLFVTVNEGKWKLSSPRSPKEETMEIEEILNAEVGIPSVSDVVSGDFVARFFAALKQTPQ